MFYLYCAHARNQDLRIKNWVNLCTHFAEMYFTIIVERNINNQNTKFSLAIIFHEVKSINVLRLKYETEPLTPSLQNTKFVFSADQ